MSEFVNPALVGELVVLVLVLAVVWMVLKEVTRMALKIIIPAALVLGAAVWLGILDQTVVGNLLTSIGEGVLSVIRVVASWVTSATMSG